MSSYDPLIPANLPPPATGVQFVQGNFSTYSTVFDNNHVALNVSNQGKHTNVILQEQSADPSVDGSFSALYGKSVVSASSTSQEMFSRIPQFLTDDKPNNPTQMTFNVVNTAGPQYQSFLPGGYIIYFGSVAGANIVNTQVTLVPAPSEILCVIPNPTKFSSVGPSIPTRPIQVAVTVNNASQFTINATFPTGTGDIKWLAICRQ